MGNSSPRVRTISLCVRARPSIHAAKSATRTGITVATSAGMRTQPNRRQLLITTAWLSIMLAAVIQGQTPPTWRIAEAPAELRPAISRADLIIAAMHDALLWELNSGLEQGGALLAIKSCHIDSARVSQRVGQQEGVASGRTSDRLRNPTNTPRPWASSIVKENAGRRVKDVGGFAVDLGDKVGVIRPISERPQCASCHGRPEKFSTAIRAELAARYPADRAVGFDEGEIRGWYWVEMPKQPSR